MSDDAMDEPRRTIVITGVSRGLGAALLERDARGGRNPRRVALLHGEAGGAAGAHNGRGATERRQ